MSKSPVVIALTVVLLAGSARAQETDPAKKVQTQWAAEKAERAERQTRLDELMGTLTEEMANIREAKNHTERQALMVKHREHMQEAMSLMRGMGGERMRELMAEHMGSGLKHEMKSEQPQRVRPSWGLGMVTTPRPRAEMSDAQRLIDLENRLDMMQVMMESMMVTHTK